MKEIIIPFDTVDCLELTDHEASVLELHKLGLSGMADYQALGYLFVDFLERNGFDKIERTASFVLTSFTASGMTTTTTSSTTKPPPPPPSTSGGASGCCGPSGSTGLTPMGIPGTAGTSGATGTMGTSGSSVVGGTEESVEIKAEYLYSDPELGPMGYVKIKITIINSQVIIIANPGPDEFRSYVRRVDLIGDTSALEEDIVASMLSGMKHALINDMKKAIDFCSGGKEKRDKERSLISKIGEIFHGAK